MIEYWDFDIYGYDASGPSGMGMMTTLPVDDERDLVAELREVVEEVTRTKLPKQPARPMGFL